MHGLQALARTNTSVEYPGAALKLYLKGEVPWNGEIVVNHTGGADARVGLQRDEEKEQSERKHQNLQ